MSKFDQITILLSFLLIQAFLSVSQVNAANQINFTPEITVGTFAANTAVPMTNSDTSYIGQYIKQIYNYAIGIVAILAVVVMMVGGILWMTAGGNQTQVSSAKSWISGSLLGLLLAMGSYVILKTINPDLVNFKISSIPAITLPQSQNGTTSSNGFLMNSDNTNVCCSTPADCGSGYTCNMTSISPTCSQQSPVKGVCVAANGQAENTICDPNKTTECAPPLVCIAATGTNSGRCWRDNYYGCGDNNSQICRTICSKSDWHSGGASCPSGLWCCDK